MSLTDEQNRFIIEFLATIPPLEDAALRLCRKMNISAEKYQSWLQDKDFHGTIKRILTNLNDPPRRKVFHRWLSEQSFDFLSFVNMKCEYSILSTYQEMIHDALSAHIIGDKKKALQASERFFHNLAKRFCLDEHTHWLLLGISNELNDILHDRKQIRQCQADDCNCFFFPRPQERRQQKYCSTECSGRMRQKRKRTKSVT
ncbi:MAG: hypothetical protein ACE5PV_26220 [Candidatus Poribacteria bacterium]